MIDLREVEHRYERESSRVAGRIANMPRPSSWLLPARDAWRQAAGAVAQARSASGTAVTDLLTIGECYAEVAAACERLAR